MTSSTHIARSDQMSSQDDVRWGDRLTVSWDGTTGKSNAGLQAALNNALGKQGKQLLNLHWRWPCSMQLALVLVPQFDATETGVLRVAYQVSFGSGNSIQLPVQETIQGTGTAAGNAVLSLIDTSIILPAQDVQVTVTGLSTDVDNPHPLLAGGSVQIGAFIAPQTEVHAMTEMLACLCRLEDKGNDGAGVDQRQGDWMPPGFYPEHLRYRR